MTFEEAVVPAIQVILASWVAIVTAGAAYMFVQGQSTERRLVDVERQLRRLHATVALAARLGDAESFSGAGAHEELDDDA